LAHRKPVQAPTKRSTKGMPRGLAPCRTLPQRTGPRNRGAAGSSAATLLALSAAQRGRGRGPVASAMGRVRWRCRRRVLRAILWNPPPHPDPLRPRGRRGRNGRPLDMCVSSSVEVPLLALSAAQRGRGRGPIASAMGRVRWRCRRRAFRAILWNPPPLPDPLRPRGRRGGIERHDQAAAPPHSALLPRRALTY
jgi:hypothetical protein